jgi:hypothetical protein
MAKQIQEPGPGRSTADATFNEIKKKIAERNERAHQAARKLRTARDDEKARKRRLDDY